MTTPIPSSAAAMSAIFAESAFPRAICSMVGFVMICGVGNVAAQQVSDIGAPIRRAAEGLTSIFAAESMPDGRILITDNRETAIIVMHASGTLQRLGREGQGPREYRGAFSILRMPGDTFHVYDAANGRFSVISPDGRIAGSTPLVRPQMSSFSPPRVMDVNGNFYFDIREYTPGRGTEREARVYRWHPARAALSNIATVYVHGEAEPRNGVEAYAHADAWSVTPSGRFIRVFASDYHVEWKEGGSWSRGPAISYAPVPVTEADREAFVEERFRRPAGSVTMSSPAPSGSRSTDRTSTGVQIFYPREKPPFEGGFVPSTPEGELWIPLLGPHDARHTLIDVISPRGEHVRRLRVPGRARVVGFGPGEVYLSVRDHLDLEWLTVFRR